MYFSKHQKEILKRINSGEIYDILSYVKSFDLMEFKKIDKSSIDDLFAQDNIPKTYYHANDLSRQRSNIFTKDEFNSKRKNGNIDSSEYTKHTLILKYEGGTKQVSWNENNYCFNLYEGVYICTQLNSLLDFLIVWQYLKSNMLVLEVTQNCTKETLQLFLVPKTNSQNCITDIESRISKIDFENFTISDKYYLGGVEYQLSDDYLRFQDFFEKRIYASPSLSTFISNKYKTKEERIQSSALWAAWLAIFVSIVLTFVPWLYETNSSNDYTPIVNSISSDVSGIKLSLEDILQAETENNSLEIAEINDINEKISNVCRDLQDILNYVQAESEFSENEIESSSNVSAD